MTDQCTEQVADQPKAGQRRAEIDQQIQRRFELDQQIAQAHSAKESAIDADDFDTAAVLRGIERQLIAAKAAREQDLESQGGAA
jgi:protein-arginine kinase activator protein McsA